MESEDHRTGTRPKRQTRPPTRFDDYQLNYIGHRQRDRHGHEEEWSSHEEGAAKMTPLYSTPTPYTDHHRREAALHEADLYHPERQRYSPETQLAHLGYPERESREEIREPPSPHHATQERTLRDELREIQIESSMLQQSQQAVC